MRLTLDWDIPGWRRIFFNEQDKINWVSRKIFKLVRDMPTHKIELFQTKNGFHVIIYDLPKFSPSLIAYMRKWYGDDPLRIKIDSKKVTSPKQVLWTKKKGFVPKLLMHWEGVGK